MLKTRPYGRMNGRKKIITIAIVLLLLVGAGIMIYKNLKSIENCRVDINIRNPRPDGKSIIIIDNDCGYIFRNVTFRLIKIPTQ